MMTNLKRTGIGSGATGAVVCLITLLTAMPAFARKSAPSAAVRTSCFVGSKVTIDEQIVGCTAVIAAEVAKTKTVPAPISFAAPTTSPGTNWTGRSPI